MKKVLIFTPVFSSGGAEAFIVNFLEHINLRKYLVDIVCIEYYKSIYDSRLAHMKITPVPLIREDIRNPIMRYTIAYKAFKRYIKERKHEYSVAHFHIAQGEELPFLWIANKGGITVRIMHSHNSSVDSMYKLLGHKACKWLFSNTATVEVACSDLAAEWLVSKKRFYNGEYEIIKNGIDTDKFEFSSDSRNRMRQVLGIVDKRVIINVATLTERKNQMFLLDCMPIVMESVPEIILLIVGDGEMSTQLKMEIHKRKLEHNVWLLGNRTDVPELLCASDVFVLPSHFEGLPFTVIEAQANGLTCVVSKTVSNQCEITNLVKFIPLNTQEYSMAIVDALGNKNVARSSYKQQTINAGYDINITTAQLLEYYQ